MKRLFSGRSMIVPLTLRSCHPESVPEDFTVSFSVFDRRTKLPYNKFTLQSHNISYPLLLQLIFPQFWPQKDEVNVPSI
jgi:hypothetical protein